jgi:hypothetical protein
MRSVIHRLNPIFDQHLSFRLIFPGLLFRLGCRVPGLLPGAPPPLHCSPATAVVGRQVNIAIAKNDTSLPALVAFSAEVSGNGYQLFI